MILRGVLDWSLGNMLCIRGFAKMGDLAKVSKADKSYQRDLIGEHKQEVLDFLHKKETLFFPEIILSYGIDDLQFNIEKFEYDNKFLKIRTRVNRYKNKKDTRGIDKIQIATIDIKQHQVKVQDSIITPGDVPLIKSKYISLFHRIDGNHRLSAADDEKDDQDIQNLITPFCLLLLPKQDEINDNIFIESDFKKLEKTIFHNINYKHIPLKKEHHYKMLIQDSVFDDLFLAEEMGEEYLYARKYLQKFNYKDFGALKTALTDNIYTFTHSLQKILIKKDGYRAIVSNSRIHKALTLINRIYTNNQTLSTHKHYGLLIAFVYFAVRTNKALSEKELNAFANWIIENFIYKITQKDANSIIAMYENIIEKRYKEIFISMDFSTKYKATYQAIQGVADTINTEQTIEIKLCPVRIDQFKTGYSYKLDEQIFKQIEKCGLMIADLSSNNVNVYQEVGFAMGINKNNPKENILLLKQDKKEDNSADSEVGFNLRSTKQLRFKDTEDLRELLKQWLLEYYAL